MSMFDMDEKQRKTAAALVVVLLGAIVFLIIRMHSRMHGLTTDNTSGRSNSISGSAVVASTSCPLIPPSRNPFKIPTQYNYSSPRQTSDSPNTAAKEFKNITPLPVAPLTARPLQMLASLPQTPEHLPNETSEPEPPKPTALLLTTVEGPAEPCAVISVNGSKARVVAIGDVVEGFTVKQITDGRAVLANDRDMLIARKANIAGGNEKQ